MNFLTQLNEFKDWEITDFIIYVLELRQELNKERTRRKELELQVYKKILKKTSLEKRDPFANVKEHYKQEWSYPTKVVYLLTLKNTPLTSTQIHDLLMEIDDNFSHGKDPRHNINAYLYLSRKSGRIKGVKLPGIKGYFFVLPEWMESAGLKEEYQQEIRKLKI
jgi:hypothetical protein